MKKYSTTIILSSGLIYFLILGYKNKGVESLADDWPLTILGFVVALVLFYFAFGKAILKELKKTNKNL